MLTQTDGGKYSISLEFVREMMQWFKDGKALPKRYVWEIILGAYALFEKEPTMVDVLLEKGKSIDVIGDVHGLFNVCSYTTWEADI